MSKNQEKENIWNVPNLLTFLRVISAIIVTYLIFADFSIIYVVIVFVIGMSTDFFDGFVARKFNLQTEFGRKFDIIADRMLIVGAGLAFIIKFSILGILTDIHYFQFIVILIREILTIPVALIAMALGGGIPKVRNIGKATTFAQSIAFPAVLLGVFYSFFSFSLYLAVITGILGLIASIYYINDMKNLVIKKKVEKD
ncbi:MAG: CDP-alcohol phosphatidyltransferase family protein [Candidatus Nealsonbacteria bacterium]